MIMLAALAGADAWAGAPSAPKRSAWFMRTADGRQWCAFPSEAKAKQAGASDRFDGSEWALVEYRTDGVVKLVDASESEDSSTEDSYSFDALGHVTRVVRKGHYIENPLFSVTYAPGKTGKLELTAASRAIVKRQEKAKHETYFLDWPLYANLAKMPFSALIQTKPTVAVVERCIKAPQA